VRAVEGLEAIFEHKAGHVVPEPPGSVKTDAMPGRTFSRIVPSSAASTGTLAPSGSLLPRRAS
jgi:hypothetical protein